jgi:hypothetical protein
LLNTINTDIILKGEDGGYSDDEDNKDKDKRDYRMRIKEETDRIKEGKNIEYLKFRDINKDKSNKDHYKYWFEYYGKTLNKSFTYYKKVTEIRRDIKVNITQEDWDRLTVLPCYLCGYSDPKGIGLDRVDNTKREYTLDNIKPCCSNCNCMKNDFSLETILEKATLISEKWKDLSSFKTIPRTKQIMKKSIVKTI